MPGPALLYITKPMIYKLNVIVYPEGDTREIDHALHINEMVDLNGNPLPLPLPTARMIVYRVQKISTANTRNEEIRNYHLEQVRADELEEFVR